MNYVPISQNRPLISYLRETVWNVWVGSLAAIFTLYEIASKFTNVPLPSLPTEFYWIAGIALLLFAPFYTYMQEQRRADLYHTICRQIFEENYIFLSFGKESRKPPAKAVKEGIALLEEIRAEIERGDFSRAGMLISLFHEMHNLVVQFYGGSGDETAQYVDNARSAIEIALANGFSDRIFSDHLRSEAFKIYQQRWSSR